nr:G-type lectin S-receptor-like serine/threonine-protein kinase At4g03230 [Tanacetum cinerariifolium]
MISLLGTADSESVHQFNESVRQIQDLLDPLNSNENDSSNIGIPFFDFERIAASTDDFSEENKLGEGGFGPVYKGKFPGGLEVAVKRLSINSGQGLEEFKNEVTLIARLQHRNLVRLLGYCMKGNEKMLIYEYMPNNSLDAFIFDATQSALLNWPKRFEIIMGICRGLIYLHQDSRLRIIHRDLKTSNVLLDEDLNPKISDFGLAKIVNGKEVESNTKRIIGTYGYMAPEYALEGLFSIKSDVYSFGVVILEIISGKKKHYECDHAISLLNYAWQLWKEGRPLDLMEQVLLESYNTDEVLKCIIVGLLCVQEDPDDRPNMSTAVTMLTSDIATLPEPKQPAFLKAVKVIPTGTLYGPSPCCFRRFAPQWIGEQIPNNNNGWLEEELEEEEDEAMEDHDKDDAEVINLYEEADPHNRPPPTSDEETEFAPPVVQIVDVDNIPIPPVVQFRNFYVGESSASRDLLEGNDEVCVPGPMPCDLRSVHRGVKRLSKQVHDRYKTEKRIARVLRQEELRRNGQVFDITALDSAVRANTFESSKMMRLITDLSREFSELKCQNRKAEETMPPKRRSQTNPQLTLTQEDIDQLVQNGIAAAVREERERVRREATRAGGPAREPVTAPIARECSFASFMKCGPTQFHGTEGAVGLVRWFEKMENTFEISECAEVRKVKFATATLHGRALTWWNSQVATLCREVANARSWAEVKQMMTDEFCPTEEV